MFDLKPAVPGKAGVRQVFGARDLGEAGQQRGALRLDSRVPSDLPPAAWICSFFQPNHSTVVTDLGNGENRFDSRGSQRRYEVVGDCPVAAGVLQDNYVSELAYRNWTVHDTGGGSLLAYSYADHMVLSLDLRESSASTNSAWAGSSPNPSSSTKRASRSPCGACCRSA